MNGQLVMLFVGALIVLFLAAPLIWLGMFSQRGSRTLAQQPYGRR